MSSPQERHDAFYAELKELCRKHGVMIAPSHYDKLQLWDASETEGPLHQQDSMEIRLRAGCGESGNG